MKRITIAILLSFSLAILVRAQDYRMTNIGSLGGPAVGYALSPSGEVLGESEIYLVNVQILKREAWAFDSSGSPLLPLSPIPGTARPPDHNERGWKETVRMNPGEVITVIMKFDMPLGAPMSPRLKASYGVEGAEYVWHCHILEHEEHDMMHSLVVV